MKIGILTFHRSINNGAVMQCYALSKRLQQDFPQAVVEVIDYHMPKIEAGYTPSLKQYFKNSTPIIFLKKAAHLLLHPTKLRKQRERKQAFEACISQLPLSEQKIFSDSCAAPFEYMNAHYDVVIVGSDAVWNYKTRGFPNAYFPDAGVQCKKLSYAASCYGMDFLRCSDQDREKIGKILSDFSFIGARDTATEDFVAWSGAQVKPHHTCDPTALLDVNDLPIDEEKLKEKLRSHGFDFQRETIGIMGNTRMLKMIRGFYGNKYQLVALYNHLPGADVNLHDLTPYEWAYVFRYFKLTFTTFFHGTMLSLRNGVPLICISLKTDFEKKHTPKTLDVLSRLGYADWYFKTDYQTENIDDIRKKADALLQADLSAEIIEKLNAEAESYQAFKTALASILENEEK